MDDRVAAAPAAPAPTAATRLGRTRLTALIVACALFMQNLDSTVIATALPTMARAFGAAELVLDTHHSLEAAGPLYARSGFTAIEPYNDNQNATRWYGKVL